MNTGCSVDAVDAIAGLIYSRGKSRAKKPPRRRRGPGDGRGRHVRHGPIRYAIRVSWIYETALHATLTAAVLDP